MPDATATAHDEPEATPVAAATDPRLEAVLTRLAAAEAGNAFLAAGGRLSLVRVVEHRLVARVEPDGAVIVAARTEDGRAELTLSELVAELQRDAPAAFQSPDSKRRQPPPMQAAQAGRVYSREQWTRLAATASAAERADLYRKLAAGRIVVTGAAQ